MYREIYREIEEIIEDQGTAALCVIVDAKGSTPRGKGSKMLVYPDGQISGTIGGGELEHRVIEVAFESMQTGEPQMLSYSMANPERGDPGVCGGQLEVYVEPILPQPTVMVVGAGHVGVEVARLAKWLGYAVILSDDREELVSGVALRDEFGKLHHGSMLELPDAFRIHPQTYIVLTTRNVDVDVTGLPALMRTEAAFIGVIGSRRRWHTTKTKLLEMGIEEDEIEKIYSPVGLELNAETPREIAVSILAQITMLRHGGDGSSMAE